MNIEWTSCEPTLANYTKNLKTFDPLHKLSTMTPVLYGYYNLTKNKSHYDLESLLRTHTDLDTGLIAVDWKKEEYYVKLIDSGLGAIIKRKSFDQFKNGSYQKLSDIPKEYLAEYVTYTSCRPREAVITETLIHSDSMEENLEKLKEAGDFVQFDKKKIDESLTSGDIKYASEDLPLIEKIGKGMMLASLTKIDLESQFKTDSESSPGAQLTIYAMMNDGSPISVLVKNGLLVSNVGVNIYHDKDGNKIIDYVYIPSLNLQ